MMLMVMMRTAATMTMTMVRVMVAVTTMAMTEMPMWRRGGKTPYQLSTIYIYRERERERRVSSRNSLVATHAQDGTLRVYLTQQNTRELFGDGVLHVREGLQCQHIPRLPKGQNYKTLSELEDARSE